MRSRIDFRDSPSASLFEPSRILSITAKCGCVGDRSSISMVRVPLLSPRRPRIAMPGSTAWVGRCFAVLIMVAVGGGGIPAAAVTCNVIGVHKPSEAEDAFLRSDYDRAVVLYQAQLQQKPNDPALTAGLAEVLLRQQKITEADDLVQKALRQNPQSAILMTALGEVQYRAGTPWLAVTTTDASTKLDPCNPQTRL